VERLAFTGPFFGGTAGELSEHLAGPAGTEQGTGGCGWQVVLKVQRLFTLV